MGDVAVVQLVLNGERWPVRRDVGLAALARAAVLLGEGRVEVARLPLAIDPLAVMHLVLGAQPIVLLEEDASAEPDDLAREPSSPIYRTADVAELFPDFDAHRFGD